MDRPLSLKIVACLALVQGLAGLLRAFNWLQIGVDLFEQGILLLPLVGAAAFLRGLFIAVVALLYVLFFAGALLGRGWARWVGMTAAVINLLLVLRALSEGAPAANAAPWSVIPVILLFFSLSAAGRGAPKGVVR
jgi:hypothetical protein